VLISTLFPTAAELLGIRAEVDYEVWYPPAGFIRQFGTSDKDYRLKPKDFA
jgi:hypothetical protein